MNTSTRYVVAKYTNSGIGDHLACAIGAWWYAAKTGRTLVIDWRGSRFNCEPSHNCFTDYFQPFDCSAGVSVIADDSVCSLPYPSPIYPPKWDAQSISSPAHKPHTADEIRAINKMVNAGPDRAEPTVVINQHIHPLPGKQLLRPFLDSLQFQESITERTDAFANRWFGGRKLFGIHVRHGNGENIGYRAAFWLGPLSLLSQFRLNDAFDIHRRDGTDSAADARDRFKDKAAPSLIDPQRHTAVARSLFRRIAGQYNVFRKQCTGGETAALLCTDAQCVVEAMREYIPDLVTYDKAMLPLGSGPLHQLMDDTAGQIASVGSSRVNDMFDELALLRRVDSLVCMPSEFSILTRLKLGDDAVCVLKPPLVNRTVMRLSRLL